MSKTKICRDCDRDKLISQFGLEKRNRDGLRSYCRECMSKKTQEYREEDPVRAKEIDKKTKAKNRDSINEKQRARYQENKLAKQAYGRKYRKEYIAKNPEKVKEQESEYVKRRRVRDPGFKVLINLRRRLNHLLRGSKSKTTLDLIGCDTEFLRKYLENQFTSNMTWENYGPFGWHVDHIIPLNAFDLTVETELQKASHYSNLQPLWWDQNVRKSNKV